MAQFKKMLLDKGAKGRPGKTITPKAVVVHWTANTNAGADAVANRNYFNNSGVYASTQYIVDDHQVVQCLPEDEMAYHVGARSYKKAALEKLSSYPNDCTIGIEMCVNKDGDFEKMYKNTVALVADILRRYNWGIDRIWRHYDITGKDCPRYFVDNGAAVSYGFSSAAAAWQRFKADVEIELLGGDNVAGKFKDMANHWAQGSVEEAAELGLVNGKSEDTFDPDASITRAESTVVDLRIYKLLLKKIEGIENEISELKRRL